MSSENDSLNVCSIAEMVGYLDLEELYDRKKDLRAVIFSYFLPNLLGMIKKECSTTDTHLEFCSNPANERDDDVDWTVHTTISSSDGCEALLSANSLHVHCALDYLCSHPGNADMADGDAYCSFQTSYKGKILKKASIFEDFTQFWCIDQEFVLNTDGEDGGDLHLKWFLEYPEDGKKCFDNKPRSNNFSALMKEPTALEEAATMMATTVNDGPGDVQQH